MIKNIQFVLLGKREATTRTSTSTEAPTTTIQTATSARFPCNMKVDAVTNGTDNNRYVMNKKEECIWLVFFNK